MDIDIHELRSTMNVIDDEALLSPQVLQEIVRAVLIAVREERAHDDRRAAESGLESDGTDTTVW